MSLRTKSWSWMQACAALRSRQPCDALLTVKQHECDPLRAPLRRQGAPWTVCRFLAAKSGSRLASCSPHPTLRHSQTDQLLSRVAGSTSTPLIQDQSLSQWWRALVHKHAEQPALISAHEPADAHERAPSKKLPGDEDCLRWTFRELDTHVRRLASGLLRMGIKRGDRVAVLMMNCSAMAALQLATAYVHAPLVTLNPSYSPLQLRKALNHVKAKALFIIPCLRDSDYIKHLRSILPTLREAAKGAPILRDDQVPTLQHVVLFDNITARPDGWPNLSAYCAAGGDFAGALDQLHGWAIDYRDVLDQGPQIAPQEIADSPNAAINLQLTSGTTGDPKAVVLNSINLINNATVLGNIMELTPNDLLANIPPLFHCFGLTLGNLAAWSRGAGVLYASEGFSPARALRSAARENATAIHGVPSHFVSELELLRLAKQASVMSESERAKVCSSLRKDGVRDGEVWSFGSLRTGFMSGSTIPVELMRSCIEELGADKLTVVYGMTETSPVSFGASIHDSVERRCTTVGQIVDHAHAKIVAGDDVTGSPVPVGQAGELWIGGYLVMSEYFEDEEKTAEAIVEQEGIRWIKTGDVAVMDGEGYVQICGRVKDVIIRGGENLFPPVIENCINQLGGIAASAVVAVPHERLGEVVGVFVQISTDRGDARRPSALQIREHVKTEISGQAAPQWVWSVEEGGVGAMPTTASGKVQKVILRQWASELSAKGEGAVVSRKGELAHNSVE